MELPRETSIELDQLERRALITDCDTDYEADNISLSKLDFSESETTSSGVIKVCMKLDGGMEGDGDVNESVRIDP